MPATLFDETSSSTQSSAVLPQQPEEESWLMDRLHTLQARVLTANLKLPASFRQKLEALDINEINPMSGESLLIAAVRQLRAPADRQKYVRMLLDAGIDPNLTDAKEHRTALMYTCLEPDRLESGSMILKTKGINLQKQDRLGNTAVMYAAMKGREVMLSEMVEFISKEWGLSLLQMKNCMGLTAEELAIRNEHHRCARMVQSQRLHMMSCMNRQLDMVGKVGSKQWCAFATVFRCIDKWKPKQRRRSEERAKREGMTRRRKKSM